MMTPVLTRSYDNTRSGTNYNETILTPASLKSKGISRLFSVALPGDARGAEAQPLIVPGVRCSDGFTHDLLLVATMSNHLYAFDANTGTPLWTQRLGNPIVGSSKIDGWLINTNWGVLSTPVVDRDANVVYSVAWSSPDGTWQNGAFAVHVNRLYDGAAVKAPLPLGPATHNPGHGIKPKVFGDVQRKQRAALLLSNVPDAHGGHHKTLFVCAGSIFESASTNLGWVVAVDLASYTISSALTTCPAGQGGGIWMAGQGPATDDLGNVYVVTGNGTYDGVTDFGESILKVRYVPPSVTASASLAVVDWFSPFLDSQRSPLGEDNDNTDDASNMGGWNDMDLGSAGVLPVKEYNLAVVSGKDGIYYPTNSNNMGKPTPDQIKSGAHFAMLAQPPEWFTFYPGPAVSPNPIDSSKLNFAFDNRTRHMHATPVHYVSPNGHMLFCWGENSNLRAWSLASNGAVTYLACSQEVASPNAKVPWGGMPGGMISLSCNGNQPNTAILWACVPYLDANKVVSPGRLLAYDATNFDKYPDGSAQLVKLWDSQDWNITFTHNKFNIPVVSGGKVFVPTYSGTIDVYG